MITPTEQTATETSNPTPADIPISAAGQALREQLTEARVKANHPGAKPFEARTPLPANPTLKDPDTGQELDLATGEKVGEPQSDDYRVVPEVDLLPAEHREEAEQIALDLEAIGQAHNIPAERMQLALDAGADIFMTAEKDLGLSTREAGLSALTTRYGETEAAKIISEAQRMTAYLGPDFATYMEATGLGNSLAVVSLLAANFRGDLSLSPEQARQKIAELRKSDKAMDRAVIDRVKILARVAAGPKPKAETEGYASRATSSRVTSAIGAHQTAAELRAELDALQKPGSDLFSSDNTRRSKAVKKRQALQQQLAAKEGK